MKYILEKIQKTVINSPDKNAFICQENKLTYHELWTQALYYSEFLKKQGNEPVIIYGHKEKEMLISLLACIMAKRAYIPVDAFTPEERIKTIIRAAGSTLLIKNREISISDIECRNLQSLSSLSCGQEKENINETAYIIFTSGSTGLPKGVPISYKNLQNFIAWILSIEPLNSYRDINILNQASFSFDLSVTDIFYSLCDGHTLVALTKDEQENHCELYRSIRENEVNLFVSTPTFMRLCLLDSDFSEENFPHLRCAYFCGEKLEKPLVQKLFDRFPDIRIINAYGPTEATSAVSAIEIQKDMLKEDNLPVGDCSYFATDVLVENGEIILKGNSVSDGYLGDVKGGFYKENGISCYRTGDMGFTENGKLYCKGRNDTQIKYKGYRIELSDIESNILSIEGVNECAVIAKKGKTGETRFIKAFVVLSEKTTVENVRVALKKRLPLYMIPKSFVALKNLPLNANKKIDRVRLQNL